MGSHVVAFSPDGKQILIRKPVKREDETSGSGLFAVNLATKKETRIPLPEAAETETTQFFWSPDSKRIAYFWEGEIPQPAGLQVPAGAIPRIRTASRVTVCDADGSNSKVIVQREASEDIIGLEWR